MAEPRPTKEHSESDRPTIILTDIRALLVSLPERLAAQLQKKRTVRPRARKAASPVSAATDKLAAGADKLATGFAKTHDAIKGILDVLETVKKAKDLFDFFKEKGPQFGGDFKTAKAWAGKAAKGAWNKAKSFVSPKPPQPRNARGQFAKTQIPSPAAPQKTPAKVSQPDIPDAEFEVRKPKPHIPESRQLPYRPPQPPAAPSVAPKSPAPPKPLLTNPAAPMPEVGAPQPPVFASAARTPFGQAPKIAPPAPVLAAKPPSPTPTGGNAGASGPQGEELVSAMEDLTRALTKMGHIDKKTEAALGSVPGGEAGKTVISPDVMAATDRRVAGSEKISEFGRGLGGVLGKGPRLPSSRI